MAIAGCALDEPSRLVFYVESMASANGISRILQAVQEYLDSWPKARIADLQKIDGGWAPFDERQQPLQMFSGAAVHSIRNAIHAHCIALQEAGMEPSPELLELEEFLSVASKMIEGCGEAASQRRTQATRTPSIPTYRDMFANW